MGCRSELAAAVDGDTACVLLQHPNFFGCLEDVGAISEAAHAVGALSILSVDPISLGLLKPPGDYGIDIVVGDVAPAVRTARSRRSSASVPLR